MALPFLESMKPLARASQSISFPRRIGFIYTPNGYNQSTFIPQGVGAHWETPPALTPLEPIRDDITLFTGLDRRFVGGTGVHAQCGSCWLTSSAPEETLDGGFPTNTTLDQLLARQLGGSTPLPSLELSCNDFTDNKETKYFESVSWYGPGYAANTEKNPRNVFRRLFGTGSGSPHTQSVLDVVYQDAKSLRSTLTYGDQQKLDEYLESVRATESRIQRAELAAKRVGRPPIAEPVGIPERRDDYLRLMGDLMIVAFQLDMTRVATWVIDPERWDSPRMLDGLFDSPTNHHVLTHTKGEEAAAQITEIDRYHVALYAYVVEKLKSIPEGNGTLLDHTTLIMGSGISDGDRHDYNNLQTLIAGNVGGSLTPKGHVKYEGERPLADLWLSILRSLGQEAPRFADSVSVLKEFSFS